MARKNVTETTESVAEKENVTETVVTDEKELSFSKQAFISSKSYKHHRDLLETILESEKSYTKSEVNKLIDDYLKGKVK